MEVAEVQLFTSILGVIYRVENRVKISKMDKYTIKKDASDTLHLIGEDGIEVPITDILSQRPAAKVFAFYAPMGAGKTTFISELSRELGTIDVVNSPTFAIVNVYSYSEGEIYHFDCYRLKDIREAIDLGAEDYLYSGNYCFVEWPDIIESLLPEETVYIRIKVEGNGDRTLEIENKSL